MHGFLTSVLSFPVDSIRLFLDALDVSNPAELDPVRGHGFPREDGQALPLEQ